MLCARYHSRSRVTAMKYLIDVPTFSEMEEVDIRQVSETVGYPMAEKAMEENKARKGNGD